MAPTTTRVTLDLTDSEMTALGYSIASGVVRQKELNPEGGNALKDALVSLYRKVHDSNARFAAFCDLKDRLTGKGQ